MAFPSDKSNEPSDNVVITPSGSIFTQAEWEIIKEGTENCACNAAKSKAKKILSKKFPYDDSRYRVIVEANVRAGGLRKLRQNYLWMIRGLLNEPQESRADLEICTQVCVALHNFNYLCGRGVFLRQPEMTFVNWAMISSKDDDGFWSVLRESFKKTVARELGDLKKGTVSWPRKVSNQGLNNLAKTSSLINAVWPQLLGIRDIEFQVFGDGRSRTSAKGRPVKAKASVGHVKIQGLEGDSAEYNLRTNYAESFNITGRASLKEKSPSKKRKHQLPPPPREDEILLKAVSRLMMVRHATKFHAWVGVSDDLSDIVTEFQRGDLRIRSPLVKSVCNLLWIAARRQPIVPWDTLPEKEDAGRFLDLPEFGQLECDFWPY